MKLQLALDLVNIPEAIGLVKEVEEHIAVVEIFANPFTFL